jgi:hypothetical protein
MNRNLNYFLSNYLMARVPPPIRTKQPTYKLGDMDYRRLEIPRVIGLGTNTIIVNLEEAIQDLKFMNHEK